MRAPGGNNAAGIAGAIAGKAGASSGKGGTSAGSGPTTGGQGGATAGAGTGGATSGNGGAAAGSGGVSGGSGGATSGSGGTTAGSSGASAGKGGTSAGSAGSAGKGGASAGSGGTAGKGGTSAGGGGKSGGGSTGASGASGGGGAGQGGQAPACGNGKKEGSEACDGADLGGATCATVVGGSSTGKLSCSSGCQLNTLGCSGPLCGNGALDTGEACDGESVRSGFTCLSQVGALSKGIVKCRDGCKLELSDCSFGCNPMTSEGCASPGEICLLASIENYSCYPIDPQVSKGEHCDTCPVFEGCKPGLACMFANQKCTQHCQTDADCTLGGVCDLGQGRKGFGLCATQKGAAKAPCGP